MLPRLVPMHSLVFLGLGLFLAATAVADGPVVGSTPPSLGPVVWADRGTTFEALQGKTVVVLTYVTWCPKCNAWSGDVVSGLGKAITDKPVVVLAISTDTLPDEAQKYMAERKLIGPQVLHGYDPTLARRLEFANEFFNYAIVGPEGKIVASGNAGSYRTIDGNNVFSPEYDLKGRPDLGQFRFLKDGMSATLKELIFPMELGIFPAAAEMTRLKRVLKADDRKAFDEMLSGFLDDQLADAARLAEGETVDKLSAFDKATFLSGAFKATEQGKKARKLVADLNKEKDLKKELAAKRLFDDCMKQAGGNAARQTELLRSVTRKFPGTHYATLAGSFADERQKPRSESPE